MCSFTYSWLVQLGINQFCWSFQNLLLAFYFTICSYLDYFLLLTFILLFISFLIYDLKLLILELSSCLSKHLIYKCSSKCCFGCIPLMLICCSQHHSVQSMLYSCDFFFHEGLFKSMLLNFQIFCDFLDIQLLMYNILFSEKIFRIIQSLNIYYDLFYKLMYVLSW